MNRLFKTMNQISCRQAEQGFSLVELMVSITVSLILLVGIAQIYIGSKESYRVNDDIRFMQESGRFGLENLTEALLMADHWGGVDSDLIEEGTLPNPDQTSGDCNTSWIFDVNEGIRGVEGAPNASNLTGFQDCIQGEGKNYVANSDVLILRYAGRQAVADSDLSADEVFIRSSVGHRGVIFEGNDGLPASLPEGLGADDAPPYGVRNYEYHVEAYYLRPCRDMGGNAVCGDTDDDTVPTLMKLYLDGNTIRREELVDGVEQLQFEYGIDTDQDGTVDRFMPASNVTDWDEVSAVRIDMLVRTVNKDLSHDDEATYTLAGGGTSGLTYTPSALGDNENQYRRKQMSKVVQLRNRTRS